MGVKIDVKTFSVVVEGSHLCVPSLRSVVYLERPNFAGTWLHILNCAELFPQVVVLEDAAVAHLLSQI